MNLKYSDLPDLPDEIKDSIAAGAIALYHQKDAIDDKGSKYIMIIGQTYFRIDQTGKLILPPLETMPTGADKSDIVLLKKD